MLLTKLLSVALFLSIPSALLAGSVDQKQDRNSSPGSGWSVEVQTAQIFGLNNPNDYLLAAQYLSLVYRADEIAWRFESFELTPEFLLSAVGQAVLRGPENHYFGGALRGRLVLSRPASKWSCYLESGAGAGAIDSTGPPSGLGQDFTFNLLLGGGVRYAFAERCTVGIGVLYQHLSNADLSEPDTPNVGLDAVGPSLTVGIAF